MLTSAATAECIYQRRWTPPVDLDAKTQPPPPTNRKPRSKEDDAKLVFGVIFSLRNMVRRLGGDDDEFISYRTGEYKLHYYETPTSMKFVMLTDTKTSNLRVVLHQIWATLYVEFVVRNPLSPVEHPKGLGVNNELFELGLDRFVVSNYRRMIFGTGFNEVLRLKSSTRLRSLSERLNKPRTILLSKGSPRSLAASYCRTPQNQATSHILRYSSLCKALENENDVGTLSS